MGTKRSIFQPGHDGRPTPNKPGPSLNTSHNPGRAIEHDVHVARGMERRYSGAGIDPRVGGVAKHQSDLQIHGGMVKQTRNGPAFGGDHASALDSLSGEVVVPGTPTNAPGWGNEGARSGHPLVKPPQSKDLHTPLPVIGHRSRTGSADGSTGDLPGPGLVAGGRSFNHDRAQGAAVKNHADRIALGQRVLSEALDCAEPDHPGKLGIRS